MQRPVRQFERVRSVQALLVELGKLDPGGRAWLERAVRARDGVHLLAVLARHEDAPVAELLARARLIGVRADLAPLELRPCEGVSDEAFHAGAMEFLAECSSGFRKEARDSLLRRSVFSAPG